MMPYVRSKIICANSVVDEQTGGTKTFNGVKFFVTDGLRKLADHTKEVSSSS